MQYRSGSNPHEPTNNSVSSRCWLFILRDSYFKQSPQAWQPHANFCAWLAYPVNNAGKYLVRGVIQFNSTRNYYTLKSRYSHYAEWIPITPTDQRRISEFTEGKIYGSAQRFSFGVQLKNNYSPTVTRPLHKVGLNIDIPDLVEDFENSIWASHIETGGIVESYPTAEEEERDEKAAAEYDSYLDRVVNADHIFRNPYNGEEIGGTVNGHVWSVSYEGKRRRIL